RAAFKKTAGTLGPGQAVTPAVHFNNKEPRVVVPTVAVSPGANGFFSYVVKDEKVQMAPVTVARENGGFTAVSAGLSEGDHVVIEGQAQLADQQHVDEQFDDKALNVASAEQPAHQTETLAAEAEQ
ncbi:efflux RND transporter periplasmic adaptor subunit, partial [Rhizobium sp. SEMIA 4085]|nr:efflux RND transporter periplasmic adaptor subunit [Rhizobium sp. SEMIA 4085]